MSKPDPEKLRLARAAAQWSLGDHYWADMICDILFAATVQDARDLTLMEAFDYDEDDLNEVLEELETDA